MNDKVIAINNMPIEYWTHNAVVNQVLCQGIGDFCLVCAVLLFSLPSAHPKSKPLSRIVIISYFNRVSEVRFFSVEYKVSTRILHLTKKYNLAGRL